MSFDEYKRAWASLTEAQRQHVRDKASWEHMTLWAVMNEWGVPGEDGHWLSEPIPTEERKA